MAHPNVEKYMSMVESGTMTDPTALREMLAEDVVWYEAGNPEPIRGRDAVVERMGSFPGDEDPTIEIVAAVSDDDHMLVEGTARFVQGDKSVSYRYVERYTMRDGVVTERRSFMDAVPGDVAAFFGG